MTFLSTGIVARQFPIFLPKFLCTSGLLRKFISQEIIKWTSLELEILNELSADSGLWTESERNIALKVLCDRVTEHNILVISKYYSRIRIERLSSLIGISLIDAETALCGMVCKKALSARIDRPAATVLFMTSTQASSMVNWKSLCSLLT